MGHGAGKGEGHADPADLHPHPHLREAPHRPCRARLKAFIIYAIRPRDKLLQACALVCLKPDERSWSGVARKPCSILGPASTNSGRSSSEFRIKAPPCPSGSPGTAKGRAPLR